MQLLSLKSEVWHVCILTQPNSLSKIRLHYRMIKFGLKDLMLLLLDNSIDIQLEVIMMVYCLKLKMENPATKKESILSKNLKETKKLGTILMIYSKTNLIHWWKMKTNQ